MSAFDKVIGYEDIKSELLRFADVLKDTKKYSRLGVTPPTGILIYGVPGLGKTLMANCFIEETGYKSFVIRKEKPNGGFVKYIKEVYEEAKRAAPSIVFLDDMDKFSNEDERHTNTEEYVTIQSCIDDCKGSNVFTIATINDKYLIPPSLLRAGRFDEIIVVEPPEGRDAELMIEYFLKQKKTVGDIDYKELAMIFDGRSCAELETVINHAGVYAGYADRKYISKEDIVKAFLRLEFEAPECSLPLNRDDQIKSAIHESGHTIVSEILNPGSVSLVSIYGHLGANGGITKYYRSKNSRLSKTIQEQKVISSLGGKAAIEMILGEQDIGCFGDVGKVFNDVEFMLDDCCSQGFSSFARGDSSHYVGENKDRMIISEVERYYRIAKQIIVENRDFLEEIEKALLDKKTLTHRDIEEIKESVSMKRKKEPGIYEELDCKYRKALIPGIT